MYNPIELSKKTEELVIKDELKKYYRFRPAGFYGGIATADTVGCNLRCKFCWSSQSVWDAKNTGEFYSPREVAKRLQRIADSKGYHQLRISGGEPTIGRQHLLGVLEALPRRYTFILETNGLLLGCDKDYVHALSSYPQLHVRICLKGADSEEFSLFTGANQGFEFQMKALQFLQDYQMNFTVALVSANLVKKQDFFTRLEDLGLGSVMLEEEEIQLYPLVKKRLLQEQLLHYFE